MVKINVARITPEFYEKNFKGGLAQHIVALSKELKKLGIRQTIFTTRGNSKNFELFHFNPKPPLSQLRSGDFAFEKFQEVVETLNREFDIVHIHNPHFYRFLLHKEHINAKTIVTMHGSPHLALQIAFKRHLFYFNKLKQNLYLYYSAKRCAALADAIVVLNEYEYNKFKKDRAKAKILKVSAGVDTEMFRPRRIKKDYDVISVSRFVPSKRIDVLVKAAALLRKKFPKFKMLLVGASKDDECYPEIIYLIKKYGLQKNIEIVHYVQPRELPELYSRARIFAFASEFEAMPKVVLEAMACGLGVVAYNTPGVRDAVADSGILLDENTPVAFANAIELLLRDERMLSIMANKSLKRSKMFSWEHVAKKNLDVYKKILEMD